MPDKEKNLAEKLNDLCIFLDNTFNINSGGCCFVASVIAHCLEQDELEYKVGVCDYEIDEADNFYDIGCTAQRHYFIILDDIEINRDDEYEYKIFYDVCYKDLLEHYEECIDWNPTYSTINNDFIEHLIKELYVKFYETIFERESNCICL